MNKEIRKLIRYAEPYGWTFEGISGTDHPVLRHRSGARMTIPSSPSDWRALTNARADIRRVAGEGSDSGPAANYRKGMPRRDRFDMDLVRDEAEQREAAAVARLAEIIELQVRYYEATDRLSRLDPEVDKVQTVPVARELRIVRERLHAIGAETPPLQGLRQYV